MRPSDLYWGDVGFQCTRLRMIVNWSSTKGTDQNIIQLTRYIGRAKTDYGRLARIYRVRMVINPIWTKTQNDLVRKHIRKFMTLLDREHDKVLSRRGWREHHVWKPWDWEKTKRQAKRLKEINPGLFDTLRRNIEGKAYTSPTFDATRMRMDPELARLVRILRDVEFDSTGGR